MRLLRPLLIAAAAPALFSFFVGVGLHVYLWLTPQPVPQTVGEAVLRGSETRLIVLIDAGADLKQPIRMKFRDVADGQPLWLTPLALAAAKGDNDALRLLTITGSGWNDEERRDASCLAVAFKHSSIARRLANPVPPKDVCAQRLNDLARG